MAGRRRGATGGSHCARLAAADLDGRTKDGSKKDGHFGGGLSEERVRGQAQSGAFDRENQAVRSNLETKLGSIAPGAHIERIRLLTIEHEYRIEIYVEGNKVLFRVAEDMVDDFMEKGFADVGQRIEQNLETVLLTQAAYTRHGQS